MSTQELRELVAQIVLRNENDIQSFLYDGTPDDYAAQVRNPDFWGESQEITALHAHFDTEDDRLCIRVLDGNQWYLWGPAVINLHAASKASTWAASKQAWHTQVPAPPLKPTQIL